MSFDTALTKSVKRTQADPIMGREGEMVENTAGGYVFEADRWEKLMRFLILGTEGGTYYIKESKLTLDNVQVVQELLKENGPRVVQITKDVSVAGRAPKNDQALFVLAMAVAFGDEQTKREALGALSYVARIGTHLFQFADFLKAMKNGVGGRAVKRAFANWYLDKDVNDLVYQVVKYRQRGGWSHRDILRLAHPIAKDSVMNNVFKWVVNPNHFEAILAETHPVPSLLTSFVKLQGAKTEKDAVEALRSERKLSHEMVPTEVRGAKTWKELMSHLPMTALIRNLPTLTRHKLIVPMSDEEAGIVKRLTDPEALTRARVHPLNMLIAHLTYRSGKSLRGDTTWSPVQAISEALENGFYQAFHGLPDIDKRVYIGLDVSGSMFWGHLMGIPDFTSAGAGSALTLCLQKQCQRSVIRGFSHQMEELGFTGNTTLGEAHDKIERLPMGRTDCALPMLDAMEQGIEADAFIVITDNETWCGNVHPSEALKQYRKKTGINAKLIVVAMESNGFSIADPKDPGMLDVVGFDATLPQIVQEFLG